jgi:rubrerythrin
MKGGIDAWNGLVSRAEVDQGMFLIEGDEPPEEVIALAYGLEAATYRFYQDLAGRGRDRDVTDAFRQLAQDEVRHQENLWEKYSVVTKAGESRESFESKTVSETLENGKTADQLLAEYPEWIEQPREALELAMSLETDSLDLYLRMAQKVRHKEAASVFHDLAGEEKVHLKRLGELLRQKLRAMEGPRGTRD